MKKAIIAIAVIAAITMSVPFTASAHGYKKSVSHYRNSNMNYAVSNVVYTGQKTSGCYNGNVNVSEGAVCTPGNCVDGLCYQNTGCCQR